MFKQEKNRKNACDCFSEADSLGEYLEALQRLVVLVENELVAARLSSLHRVRHIEAAMYDVLTLRARLEEAVEQFAVEWEAIEDKRVMH